MTIQYGFSHEEKSMVISAQRGRLRKYRIWMFVLTYFSYGAYHISRKALGNVKYSLHTEWGLSTVFLGSLDTIFMFVYAIGMLVAGVAGDRLDRRKFVGYGMIGTGVFVSLFGLARYIDVHSPAYFAIMWGFAGLCQCTGWPGNVAIIDNWIYKKTRGEVFGLWSTNISTGNIIGGMLAAGLLYAGLNWSFVFFVPGIYTFLYGFLVLAFAKNKPTDVGLLSTDYIDKDDEVTDTPFSEDRPIGFIEAWRIPGVAAYAFAFAFLKLVMYSFLFWLPFYMSQELGYKESTADLLANLFDFGGILGTIALGIASDISLRHNAGRTVVILPTLALSALSMYIYRFIGGGGYAINSICLTVSGAFTNGVGNIMPSAVSADLGTHPLLKGNSKAMATVVGIIDGTGSLGAAIGQILVAYLSTKLGWNATFYMFIVAFVCSGLCIVPLFIKEWKSMQMSFKVLGSSRYQSIGVQNP